ncbi:putative serine protease K12H4.7 [Hylaeus anthracinus]|uniref:putative serine protease K12H4.7 n=1 Tax=Hylaeus anthracinus TaxID=313031 RepID=UPI0023B95D12|nr:putative serine protease K12H4.7 [Hylaeus anthracinus]XP_054000607.1 putative serine protease K12H4.7 [Hylaeus anthracinus]XP_054000608.1 putative serine protease K12H4.7 [Hylaeus anthracinus]XP_054000609.1 putative serine protease K12H4.7 [Hylaeus anthracinus]
MRQYLLFFLFISLVNTSIAWRSFLRGRSADGNLGAPVLSKSHELPKEQWFTQFLDHFNPTDARVWQQRYFMNGDYYKKGGPVFLMIGGEGSATAKWMVEGQWIEYAKQFGALCFQLEHRFYGKSHPVPDLSVKNLVYLTSEQALADLAYFIKSMNDNYKFQNDTKWITFGGSYAGSLAAWSRAKYPHLVHGAVSASGPLLAQIDFQEYYVVVENALKEYSQECVNVIAEANKQFHIMLRHPLGQRGIVQKFALCDPIDSGHTKRNDISNLYETLASNFAGIVQYSKDNRNNSAMANLTIESACDILTNEKLGIPLDRLAIISNKMLNATKKKCLDYVYSKMIHELRSVTWTSEEAEGGRQWMYQTCTEFGFFQTSTARPNLFSETFPVDFFVEQCIDVFGPRYNMHLLNSAVNRTNILYGALNLEVTNVVFVHGSVDPWHVLGITKSLNPQAPAIYINGTAHCANMYPPSKNDSTELKNARIQVGRLIDQWLQN